MLLSLADFIRNYTPTPGSALHLVHCQTALDGLQVLLQRSLKPVLCDVYGIDLLYMFYGRPAYKPAQGTDANAILDLLPVCFVIDPAVISSAIRILPFDSGGFPRYEPVLGKGVKLNEFELGTDATAPLRLIRAFYKTNGNYYEQQPSLKESDLAFSKITPRAYARLIADQSIRKVDDRCGTIEIQFDSDIPLKTALRALIAPASVLSDPNVEAALAECPSAVPLQYKTYGRGEPSAISQLIYPKVEDFFISQGLLP
jgi:hypothetical protein